DPRVHATDAPCPGRGTRAVVDLAGVPERPGPARRGGRRFAGGAEGAVPPARRRGPSPGHPAFRRRRRGRPRGRGRLRHPLAPRRPPGGPGGQRPPRTAGHGPAPDRSGDPPRAAGAQRPAGDVPPPVPSVPRPRSPGPHRSGHGHAHRRRRCAPGGPPCCRFPAPFRPARRSFDSGAQV
ncbi:MAG: hypothetical protein AVDCRST_MAG10-3622, partial [uncultured Acidimicrobiales bacterium]